MSLYKKKKNDNLKSIKPEEEVDLPPDIAMFIKSKE
jgi:hypothetical protein